MQVSIWHKSVVINDPSSLSVNKRHALMDMIVDSMALICESGWVFTK